MSETKQNNKPSITQMGDVTVVDFLADKQAQIHKPSSEQQKALKPFADFIDRVGQRTMYDHLGDGHKPGRSGPMATYGGVEKPPLLTRGRESKLAAATMLLGGAAFVSGIVGPIGGNNYKDTPATRIDKVNEISMAIAKHTHAAEIVQAAHLDKAPGAVKALLTNTTRYLNTQAPLDALRSNESPHDEKNPEQLRLTDHEKTLLAPKITVAGNDGETLVFDLAKHPPAAGSTQEGQEAVAHRGMFALK